MLDPHNYVPEEATKIDRRPDWLCDFCGSLNRANDVTCRSCGSPKEMAKKDYFENRREKEREKTEKYDNRQNHTLPISETTSTRKETLKSIFFSTPGKITIGVTLTFLLIALLFFLFRPKIETLEVTSFSWERSISIEEFKTVEENGWNLPAGANLLYTKQEIARYEKVLDHYETKTRMVTKEKIVRYDTKVEYKDLGNGYFEEKEKKVPVYEKYQEKEEYQTPVYKEVPIYQTKYYYEIDKWVYKETLKTNGKDKKPYDPKVSLSTNEREGSKVQKYFITGQNDKGKQKTLSLSYQDWTKINLNENVTFKIHFDNQAEVVE